MLVPSALLLACEFTPVSAEPLGAWSNYSSLTGEPMPTPRQAKPVERYFECHECGARLKNEVRDIHQRSHEKLGAKASRPERPLVIKTIGVVKLDIKKKPKKSKKQLRREASRRRHAAIEREREKRERAAARRAASKMIRDDESTSIRTVSGGLPSLGKRR